METQKRKLSKIEELQEKSIKKFSTPDEFIFSNNSNQQSHKIKIKKKSSLKKDCEVKNDLSI